MMEDSNSQDQLKPSNDDSNTAKLKKNSSIIAFATTGLLVLAIIYTLYLGKQLLLPIAIAILLSFLFAPIIRILRKIHIPNFLAAFLIILILFLIIVFGFYSISGPINKWAANAPESFSQASIKLNQLTAPVNQYVQRFFNIQEQIEKSTNKVVPQKTVPEVTLKADNWFNIIFSNTWEFFVQFGILILLLYFFLSFHEFILHKLIKILPYYSEKKEAVIIIRQIEQKISYFLVVKILISIGLAIVIGLVMMLLQMPHPFIWGILAGLLEFIPYIGVTIGTFAITFSALLNFDTIGHILLVPLSFFIICSIEGNLILPLVLNRGLILHPLIILIGVIIFGWIWGIMGALIAIPIISIFKIICDNVKPLNNYGQFLGIDGHE